MDGLGPFSIAELREIIGDASLYMRTCCAIDKMPAIEVGRADNMFRCDALLRSNSATGRDVTAETLQALSRRELPPPRIVLWRSTPDFGHFILLHFRTTPSGKVVFELFDPVGIEVNEETAARGGSTWRWYLDSHELNGEGLRPFLTALHDAGVQLSYNGPQQGPQPRSANSCGLWCIVRAWVPEPSPSEFRRQVATNPVAKRRN